LPATLYLVATPIGNLEDMTVRAIRILRDEVALIACEDTRTTSVLLHHFEIKKPLLSYHEHNEAARTTEILNRLQEGSSVALLTDAGTPLVSDPGYRLVNAAVTAGVPVVPLPGACAAILGLVASGIGTDQFRFLGFLPPKTGARRATLERFAADEATLIAYESPHRLLESLKDIQEVLGARPIVVARELTKLHEEFLRGSAAQVRELLETRGSVKGEITLVIGRQDNAATSPGDPSAELGQLLAQGTERMEAIKTSAKKFGLPKREVYRLALEQDSN
jgi:16S rRNA (cytidine1402-2'-O)-methyltransferase